MTPRFASSVSTAPRRRACRAHRARPATISTPQAASVAAALGDGEDQRRRLPRGLHELRPFGQAQSRVEHDADRRAVFETRNAAGEFGIVGERGVDADQDCIVLRAQQMTEAARLVAR